MILGMKGMILRIKREMEDDQREKERVMIEEKGDGIKGRG